MFSFTVSGDVEGADNTVLGTTVGAVNGATCTTDFVVIPNPTVVATGVAAGTDRFCGLGFVPVSSKYPTQQDGREACCRVYELKN